MSLNPDQAASLRSSYLGQLAVEHHTTLEVIRHAPEDKMEFAPQSGMRGFATLSHHIYAAGLWFAGIMASGQVDLSQAGTSPSIPATKQELLKECDRLNRQFIDRISTLSREDLAQNIEFPGIGPFAAVHYLGWHMNHLIHHRGQLSVYLRLMGAKVPAIYGPSSDYPMK